jgi:hypothetical protein
VYLITNLGDREARRQYSSKREDKLYFIFEISIKHLIDNNPDDYKSAYGKLRASIR